ncbi:MAG TPA: hypothetical protein VML94_07520 [Thermoplasmata archaeon]|nr:hypothetical protein [Thermoplasmata archaeon]
MTNRWVVGLLGVLAIAALVGVGYSAFTATATVNGTASAGTAAIVVTSNGAGACFYPSGAPAPGSFSFSENAKDTVLSISVSNMVPGGVCSTVATVSNVGTVPVSLSNQLNSTSGICVGAALNCYDVSDTAGLSSVAGVSSEHAFATLGAPYSDTISIWIPAGSVSAPPSGVFSIYYIGSAGL